MTVGHLPKRDWMAVVAVLRGDESVPAEWRMAAAAKIEAQVLRDELYAARRAAGNLRGRPRGSRNGS